MEMNLALYYRIWDVSASIFSGKREMSGWCSGTSRRKS